MSVANTDGDGLPEQPVVMRLTEGALPGSSDRYADLLPFYEVQCKCGHITQFEFVGWWIATNSIRCERCHKITKRIRFVFSTVEIAHKRMATINTDH